MTKMITQEEDLDRADLLCLLKHVITMKEYAQLAHSYQPVTGDSELNYPLLDHLCDSRKLTVRRSAGEEWIQLRLSARPDHKPTMGDPGSRTLLT